MCKLYWDKNLSTDRIKQKENVIWEVLSGPQLLSSSKFVDQSTGKILK